METFMILANGKQGKRCLLSIKKPKGNNVSKWAIFGALKSGDKIIPDNFIQNPDFIKLLHKVVAKDLEEGEEAKAQAEQTKDGHVFIIDRRTKDTSGQVPPEDIVGGIIVEKGKIKKGSYRPNTQYKLLTKDGLFELPRPIEQRLLDAVK